MGSQQCKECCCKRAFVCSGGLYQYIWAASGALKTLCLFIASSFVSLVWILQLEAKQATNVFCKRTVNVDYGNVSINWRKKSDTAVWNLTVGGGTLITMLDTDNSSNEGHCWRCSRFQIVVNSVPSYATRPAFISS
jgi:hypothetical protein